MAGRAFIERAPVIVRRPGGDRVWVPMIEGSDRTGVLALTVPATDVPFACVQDLGLLAGYLSPRSSHRSVQPASPSSSADAGCQHAMGSAAAARPQDEVGPRRRHDRTGLRGGRRLLRLRAQRPDVRLHHLDSMGHGVARRWSPHWPWVPTDTTGERRRRSKSCTRSSTTSSRGRRRLRLRDRTARGADRRRGRFDDVDERRPPLAVAAPRAERFIGELHCPATPPWGLGSVFAERPAPPTGRDSLEPGDAVLFYTDASSKLTHRAAKSSGSNGWPTWPGNTRRISSNPRRSSARSCDPCSTTRATHWSTTPPSCSSAGTAHPTDRRGRSSREV